MVRNIQNFLQQKTSQNFYSNEDVLAHVHSDFNILAMVGNANFVDFSAINTQVGGVCRRIK